MLAEPEVYRKEAERAQQRAARAVDPVLRRQWTKLAEAYIRLAEAAEEAAKCDDRDDE